MRIITVNLLNDGFRQIDRLHLAAERLKSLDPDIVALQEVNLDGSALDILNDALRGYYRLVHSRTGRLHDKEGLVLYSKFAISSDKKIDFDKQQRVAQLVKIKVRGRKFWLANVHMHWSLISDRPRQRQVEQLLSGWHKPAIILGDFNATGKMKSIRLLQKNYISALKPGKEGATYPSPLLRPGSRALIRRAAIGLGGLIAHGSAQGWSGMIDYIFYNDSFMHIKSGLVFDKPDKNDSGLYVSDHLGVLADLEFKE